MKEKRKKRRKRETYPDRKEQTKRERGMMLWKTKWRRTCFIRRATVCIGMKGYERRVDKVPVGLEEAGKSPRMSRY